MVLRSFAPIADDQSRALILGSMPGPEALRKRQYYGFAGNHFWRIVSDLLGRELPGPYPERVRMLKEGRIALWDTLGSCVRPGALDKDISVAKPNEVPELARRHPGIRAVFLNGRAAEAYYDRFFAPRVLLPAFYLPSTSPANASLPYAEKLRRWRKILRWL